MPGDCFAGPRQKQSTFAPTHIRYHADPRPRVLQTITACNIRNYSIFLRRGLLFGYFEYDGADFAAGVRKMAADPDRNRLGEILIQQRRQSLTGKEELLLHDEHCLSLVGAVEGRGFATRIACRNRSGVGILLGQRKAILGP